MNSYDYIPDWWISGSTQTKVSHDTLRSEQ
jgi:hypothetical protein